MTFRLLVKCDAVHPERVPPECRAYLSVDPPLDDARRKATATGWTLTETADICPSCTRGASA